MNIAILGGGNVGTQFAAHCASKGYSVTVYTSKPECFQKKLVIIDEKKKIICQGEIVCATNDIKVAVENADYLLVTVPAFLLEKLAENAFPYVKKGTRIGLIPGTGGGEWAFKKYMQKDAVIFGVQRVPSVARLVKYGSVVQASGYRKELFLASIPNTHSVDCAKFIENILDTKCTIMPNYLNVTLTPSNPILHTSRLYMLFKDYKEGMRYESIPLFYEEWNEETSVLLLECDREVQNLCNKLSEINLTYVKSLKEHYESGNAKQLTKKIQSIKSLQGLKTPSVEVEGKYVPDFSSRYFMADFPYGLAILVELSEMVSMETPAMNRILSWYYRILGKTESFSLAKYKIFTKEELIKFYQQ